MLYMEKKLNLREAINRIWETVKISKEQGGVEHPYLFIVGAGISAPEILLAREIVSHCQDKVRELYKDNSEELNNIFDKSNNLSVNTAEYYSYWFGQAYKNKLHRQQYLKNVINNARISTSNLLLAQILNSKEVATTVITPNFDNQLLKSLNLLGNYDVFSANNMLDNIAMNKLSDDIQIMHVHGTYNFYDCCNLENEISKIANGQGIKSTAGTIEEFIKNQTPIVIGYSGWEDDVIMTKLKERLQYAPLPYSMLWFCYSIKDYECLPNWLKESDDVFFVLPDLADITETVNNNVNEPLYLPAEDIFSALITKFGFRAPNLFSNPIQYYIELIDNFLPQNANIFPIKAWKRRLDNVEEHLEDVEKKIIELDTAAARKDIISVTNILDEIDYNFILEEDLEHIINGVILPLINSKNRIEDQVDLVRFINVILDFLIKRCTGIAAEKLISYLKNIIGFFAFYRREMINESIIETCDKILGISESKQEFEEIELTVLGIKSDITSDVQRKEILNEIIERGTNNIENIQIARVLIIAICNYIKNEFIVTDREKDILNQIIDLHNKDADLMEVYFYKILECYDKKEILVFEIDEIINQIIENDLPSDLLLHAQFLKCRHEKDEETCLKIACDVVDNYNIEYCNSCRECLDYAFLLNLIIEGSIIGNKRVEPRYIENAIELCYKEEKCKYVPKIIINSLEIYIKRIDSLFEKRELCRKAVEICYKSELFAEWAHFNNMYIEFLEKREKEAYFSDNEKYKVFCDTNDKLSTAIEAYVNHDINKCGNLLLESSEIFDKIFEGKFNPALVNICFMARRDEIPGLSIPVLEVLNKITWMGSSAFLNINKALSFISQNDWVNARKQIAEIDSDILAALRWWNQEDVVGKYERFIVIFLLVLEDKLYEENNILKTKEFWEFCMEEISIPDDMKNEISSIKEKYLYAD